MARLYDIGIYSVNATNGAVGSGYKLNFYTTGTSTRKNTYPTRADAVAGTNANSNPISAAADGRFGPIWLTGGDYKVVLTDLDDVVLETLDPGEAGGSANDLDFSHSTSYSAGTVGAKLKQDRAVTDAAFNADSTGVADAKAAFESAGATTGTIQLPAGTYNLSADPNPAADVTWFVDDGVTFTGTGRLPYVTDKVVALGGSGRSVESSSSFYSAIFAYLEQNAALAGYGTIGLHGSARSSGGSGTAGEADIGVAAFAVHDLASSTGGVWGLYSTVVKQSGLNNGEAHGLEIDIANFGSTVQITPNAMFPQGVTSGAWVCTGGETTDPTAGGSPGTASVGVAIVQNDSQTVKTAKFDKGIVFHNLAITGADGTGTIGIAIAFAVGHSMQWYNNSAQIMGEIVSTGVTQANNNYRLDFSDSGLVVQDRGNGANAFQVVKTASGVNGLSITPAATTGSPVLAAIGSDTNVTLTILSKGTGDILLNPSTGDIRWGKALVALGGGAAATLGTIGGTGPATSTQNTWMRVLDSAGAAFWVPAWK